MVLVLIMAAYPSCLFSSYHNLYRPSFLAAYGIVRPVLSFRQNYRYGFSSKVKQSRILRSALQNLIT